MRSADFTRTAATLPAVYNEDAASYAQIDTFLGIADTVHHAMLELLDDLSFAMGPDAALRWPTDLAFDAGREALLNALTSRYDTLASWFAFEAPGSWGAAEAGVATRRLFLGKAARLWRRRGTPAGFIDWFCVYFGIDTAVNRPYLLEHYKVPGGVFDAEPFTATLFVPNSSPFGDYRRRLEAAQFARWYAPAHVEIRVCYVPVGAIEAEMGLASPAKLPADPTAAQWDTYVAAIVRQANDLRTLACNVVSVVDHGNGIHIYGCGLEGDEPERSVDLLGIAKLPTIGTSIEEDTP